MIDTIKNNYLVKFSPTSHCFRSRFGSAYDWGIKNQHHIGLDVRGYKTVENTGNTAKVFGGNQEVCAQLPGIYESPEGFDEWACGFERIVVKSVYTGEHAEFKPASGPQLNDDGVIATAADGSIVAADWSRVKTKGKFIDQIYGAPTNAAIDERDDGNDAMSM